MKYMVFDVESIGLHGEAFAVGFVVVDDEGNELDSRRFSCPPQAAQGSKEGFEWVEKNVPNLLVTHDAPWLVRAAFWREWVKWKQDGAMLAADVPWPVEARFLARCVDDHPIGREWQGPYPLLDIASFLAAKGADPAATYPRLSNETPKHDPLMDARQSARLLLEVLR